MQGPVVVHESLNGCPSPELRASTGVGLVQFNVSGSAVHNEAWTTAPLANPGDWHQVAVAWDGAQQSIYLDGLCMCSEPQAKAPEQNVQRFTIGCYPTGGPLFFAGEIDEVRLYDRVLAPDEMASLVTVSGHSAPTPVACSAVCATTAP
jgi:hypothetical protein